MSPAVSIVVPCFNGGGFLDQLLGSLAAQTFRDFEVVIVDDGSSDDATLRKLAALDASIRVLRQENRGLPAARNAGFAAAQAPLVLPLDCDDALAPTALAELTGALNASPDAVFAFSHMKTRGAFEAVLPRRFNPFDQLFLNQLPCCLLIRKSAWAGIGGYDESMREGYEDWEFSIRLVRSGARGIEIAKPLFLYTVSAQGMLLSHSARKHGVIWARIRSKHADLYRAGALLAMWRAHGRSARVSVLQAMGLLGLAKALPPRAFGWLMHRLLTAQHARRAGRVGEAGAMTMPSRGGGNAVESG